MIHARGLTKRYGPRTAVADLSFDVLPGAVTGLLGPDGSGKSTTLRMLVGLDRPDAGDAWLDGRRYAQLREPLRTVGALLDPRWVHPNRSARAHLAWLARSNRLPSSRVDETLELVGLTAVAGQRVGGYSLGMAQRLGIAAAMLGDPPILLLDEPTEGLHPEGVLWLRTFLSSLARQGRTVLVSGRLLAEMEQTASELVVIGRGRLVAQGPLAAFDDTPTVLVRGPRMDVMAVVLERAGLRFEGDRGGLRIPGVTTERIGELAAAHGVVLHELSLARPPLEQALCAAADGAAEDRTEVAA
jgi:ABC-2 type transport system ATP-binding protein